MRPPCSDVNVKVVYAKKHIGTSKYSGVSRLDAEARALLDRGSQLSIGAAVCLQSVTSGSAAPVQIAREMQGEGGTSNHSDATTQHAITEIELRVAVQHRQLVL